MRGRACSSTAAAPTPPTTPVTATEAATTALPIAASAAPATNWTVNRLFSLNHYPRRVDSISSSPSRSPFIADLFLGSITH
jgi:hypothetical protein